MKYINSLTTKYGWIIVLIGSILTFGVNTFFYKDDLSSNISTVMLFLAVVLVLDSLAIWALEKSRKKITHSILIFYIGVMGFSFVAKQLLRESYSNQLLEWILYSTSSAYFFIFGFELYFAQTRKG